ncbi:MerR family transcriptional regulator [Corynebacterium coyleae]
MKISEVAAVAGCSVRAVRHLHTSGAVPEPARTSGNYRNYSVSDLAAVLRARALIDAGVPVSEVRSPKAVEESLALLDERIAQLQRQKRRLLALASSPHGAPEDIRNSLKSAINDPSLFQIELDSWDLMGFTGVATPDTWEQLRKNLHDPTCLAATQKAETLWQELGEMKPTDPAVAMLVRRLQALAQAGLMRGIFPTLNPGDVPLALSDVPTKGAQGLALRMLAGDFPA